MFLSLSHPMHLLLRFCVLNGFFGEATPHVPEDVCEEVGAIQQTHFATLDAASNGTINEGMQLTTFQWMTRFSMVGKLIVWDADRKFKRHCTATILSFTTRSVVNPMAIFGDHGFAVTSTQCLSGAGHISLIDGFHRSEARADAWQAHPTLDVTLLKITYKNYPDDKEKGQGTKATREGDLWMGESFGTKIETNVGVSSLRGSVAFQKALNRVCLRDASIEQGGGEKESFTVVGFGGLDEDVDNKDYVQPPSAWDIQLSDAQNHMATFACADNSEFSTTSRKLSWGGMSSSWPCKHYEKFKKKGSWTCAGSAPQHDKESLAKNCPVLCGTCQSPDAWFRTGGSNQQMRDNSVLHTESVPVSEEHDSWIGSTIRTTPEDRGAPLVKVLERAAGLELQIAGIMTVSSLTGPPGRLVANDANSGPFGGFVPIGALATWLQQHLRDENTKLGGLAKLMNTRGLIRFCKKETSDVKHEEFSYGHGQREADPKLMARLLKHQEKAGKAFSR